MRLIDIISGPDDLFELQFMGSTCTVDCSGHAAGYKWSLDHGGATALTPSGSFNKGTKIAAAQLKRRPQGGGKIPDYVSQTLAAKKKRAQRLLVKNAGVQSNIPPETPTGP
jgi:hypothetical protein